MINRKYSIGFIKSLINHYPEEHLTNVQEGLIKSTEIGQAIGILKRKYPSWSFEYDKNDNKFHVTIELDSNSTTDLKYFEKLLSNLGWVISAVQFRTHKNKMESSRFTEKYLYSKLGNLDRYKYVRLYCEAKFDQQIPLNRLPEKLYHSCPLQAWEKIKKQGLVPKSRSKKAYHPERVYLSSSVEKAEEIIPRLATYASNFSKDWVIIEVDMDSIQDYAVLYRDPNFSAGYYVVNNIPSQALTKIKDIQIK